MLLQFFFSGVVVLVEMLAIDGERFSGADIREQNGASALSSLPATRGRASRTLPLPLFRPFHAPAVTACMALANIVKSSLGPVGLDKMLVSDS